MLYKDCYADFDGRFLKIGNATVAAVFEIRDGVLYCTAVQNRKSGYEWKNQGGAVFCSVPSFSFLSAERSCTHRIEDKDGLSEPYLETLLTFKKGDASVCLRLSLFPALPFIESTLSLHGKFGGKSDEIL